MLLPFTARESPPPNATRAPVFSATRRHRRPPTRERRAPPPWRERHRRQRISPPRVRRPQHASDAPPPWRRASPPPARSRHLESTTRHRCEPAAPRQVLHLPPPPRAHRLVRQRRGLKEGRLGRGRGGGRRRLASGVGVGGWACFLVRAVRSSGRGGGGSFARATALWLCAVGRPRGARDRRSSPRRGARSRPTRCSRRGATSRRSRSSSPTRGRPAAAARARAAARAPRATARWSRGGRYVVGPRGERAAHS